MKAAIVIYLEQPEISYIVQVYQITTIYSQMGFIYKNSIETIHFTGSFILKTHHW